MSIAFSRSAWRGIALAGALALGAAAHAGEINDLAGPAINGYDPVAYFEDGRPVEGSGEYTADYKGATFRFASAENRDQFAADPDAFAPQYGGFCAYAAARGYKADVDPDAFRVVDGKLYLNYDQNIQAEWSKDIPGYIAKADANWPTVVRSTDVIR